MLGHVYIIEDLAQIPRDMEAHTNQRCVALFHCLQRQDSHLQIFDSRTVTIGLPED